MTRKIVVLLLGIAAATVPAVPASAGGFCSDPAAGLYSDESGDSVRMVKSCFTPTVLRIDAGDTVTFVNTDPEFHAVGGVAGTFGDMHREIASGKEIGITFEDEGVFPYVCILHPGMGGAVVVGDGRSATAASLPVGRAEDVTSAGSKPAVAVEREGPGVIAWWPLAVAVGAAAAAATIVTRRRRPAPTAAATGQGPAPRTG